MRIPAVLILTVFLNSATAAPPNVLLLVSDDQRSDTIHALGNSIIQTPSLDQLVASGSSFTRATCANPICTPSRAEILTGCCGFRCGVMDFGKPIHSKTPTLARWFAKFGYTASYVGKWHNDGRPVERGYAFTRGLYRGGGGRFARPMVDFAGRPTTGYTGWIFQDDEGQLFPGMGVGLTSEISQYFADAAIEVIRTADQKPFFLHVNFTAPHDPLILPKKWIDAYQPEDMRLPENFLPRHPFNHGNFDGRDERLFKWPRTPGETRRELAAYYAVISHMDEQIGRILEALDASGKSDNTIVVFASDHGLGVGSHGLRGKQNMYEHTIGVPLIFRGPGVPKGELFDAQCYLRDLFATLCDLTGIESPGASIDSRSLVPVLNGKSRAVHPFIVGYFRNMQRMIRTNQWKYIEYPEAKQIQLFQLSSDPYEKNNLANDEEQRQVREQLQELMQQWFRAQGDAVYQ